MKRLGGLPLLHRLPGASEQTAPSSQSAECGKAHEPPERCGADSAHAALAHAGQGICIAVSTDSQQAEAAAPRSWRTRLRAWCLLPLACTLASCADDEGQAPTQQSLLHQGVATDIRHNTLMDAAFGPENELIVPGEVYWQAVLPLPQVLPPAASAPASKAGKARPAQAASIGPIENQSMAVRPREAVRLNDGQVALVVESVPLGQITQPTQPGSAPAALAAAAASVAASAPAHMGVVFFQADAAASPVAAKGAQSGPSDKNEPGTEQWRAVRLVPYVDALMAGPALPDVQVYRLNASRYLVTYTQTACQTGVCSRWLKGYLLQPETMRPVFSTRLASSNAEQWADCPARLGLLRANNALSAKVRQLHAQPPAAGASSTASPTWARASVAAYPPDHRPVQFAASTQSPVHSCHAVLGEVHLLSRGSADAADVQIRYSGAVSDAPGHLRPIAQTQRFRLQGDQLLQIDGAASPVPAQP